MHHVYTTVHKTFTNYTLFELKLGGLVFDRVKSRIVCDFCLPENGNKYNNVNVEKKIYHRNKVIIRKPT